MGKKKELDVEKNLRTLIEESGLSLVELRTFILTMTKLGDEEFKSLESGLDKMSNVFNVSDFGEFTKFVGEFDLNFIINCVKSIGSILFPLLNISPDSSYTNIPKTIFWLLTYAILKPFVERDPSIIKANSDIIINVLTQLENEIGSKSKVMDVLVEMYELLNSGCCSCCCSTGKIEKKKGLLQEDFEEALSFVKASVMLKFDIIEPKDKSIKKSKK